MKKVYVVVISAVTVMCVVVGTLIHVGGWMDGSIFSFGVGSGNYQEYEKEQSEFKSLRIEADVMSIKIQRGDGYHISYKASEKLMPKIELKGDTLVVTQPSKGFSFWSWGNKKCEMTLTVPEGVQLADAEFDMDVGNLVISGISIEHMKIMADVGNVELDSCVGNRLEAESDVGNIEIRSSDFVDSKIETDVGNVYYSAASDLSEYDVNLATDIGKVTVDGNSYKRQFNQTASGDSNGHRLSVETDTGNIEIATSR